MCSSSQDYVSKMIEEKDNPVDHAPHLTLQTKMTFLEQNIMSN